MKSYFHPGNGLEPCDRNVKRHGGRNASGKLLLAFAGQLVPSSFGTRVRLGWRLDDRATLLYR
jgi:hypothetical protein